MVRLCLLLFCIYSVSSVFGQTCTMSNTGPVVSWTNASAITCVEGGNLSTKTVLVIPAGKTIVFDDVADTWTGTRIEIYGTLNITADVTINANLEVKSGGLVTLSKKLSLGTSSTNPAGCNYQVVIRQGGTVDVGTTGTDRLSVCGVDLMQGNGTCNDCGGTNSGTCAYNGKPYCEPAAGFQGPLGFDQNGSNSSLPIKLKSFNVELVKDAVEITWVTEKEENFSYFEVQKSGEDFDFNSFQEIAGAGYNTSSLQQYVTVDYNPLMGVNYYRLKAVDVDGSYEIFPPKYIVNNKGRSLRVAPNPVSGNTIKYSINFEPGVYDRISLIDPVGTELQSAFVTGTENEFVLDKSLKPGAYLLRYTSSTFQEVARVFVKN